MDTDTNAITRAGLISVPANMETRFRKALPPQHHIRSTRPWDEAHRHSEHIVEGPMMPAWSDRNRDPKRVEIIFMATYSKEDPDLPCSLHGQWFCDGFPLGDKWRIGPKASWVEMQNFLAA